MLLVTGATGYLGAALVAELVRRGHRVRAVVRDPAKAAALPAGVERVTADLERPRTLRAAVDGCDGIFHLAGIGRATPERTRLANVAATVRLLRAAAVAGVRRVVFTSAAAALLDATGLIRERAPDALALTDPYLLAKAESEALMAAAAGPDAVIVNPASCYGPSPAGPRGYNALLIAAARGEIRQIVDARIGWVLAEDVAIGHILAFEHGRSGQRYVLSGPVESFATVLNTYATLTGSPHRVTALPAGSTLPADAPPLARRSQEFGAVGAFRIDDSGARGLGFTPRGIDTGLPVTAAWLTRRPRR